MCDKCENNHKYYKCICVKDFKSKQALIGHYANCQQHKNDLKIQQEQELLFKESKRLPNGMFKCENPKCQKEHDGSYGSGRFCSDHCRRVYIGLSSGKIKRNRKNINSIIKNRAPYGTWCCKRCNLIFETRRQLQKHNQITHLHQKGHSWNYGLTKETDDRIAKLSIAVSKTLKDGFKSGRLTVKPHTEEFKKAQRERAIKRELGGKHTSKRIIYNGIELGSSYELLIAKSLDENKIHWVRPSYFKWEHPITHKIHNYYPDFYLPDYNIYLDPKNDFLINNVNPHFGIKDLEKIKIVEETNKITILILNKNQLSWDEILKLIEK